MKFLLILWAVWSFGIWTPSDPVQQFLAPHHSLNTTTKEAIHQKHNHQIEQMQYNSDVKGVSTTTGGDTASVRKLVLFFTDGYQNLIRRMFVTVLIPLVIISSVNTGYADPVGQKNDIEIGKLLEEYLHESGDDIKLLPNRREERINGLFRKLREVFPNNQYVMKLVDWANDHEGTIYEGNYVHIAVRKGETSYVYFHSPYNDRSVLTFVIEDGKVDISFFSFDSRTTYFYLGYLYLVFQEINDNVQDEVLKNIVKELITEIEPFAPKDISWIQSELDKVTARKKAMDALEPKYGDLSWSADNVRAEEVLQGEFSIRQGQGLIQTFGAQPCVICTLYDPSTKTALLTHIDAMKDVPLSFNQMLRYLKQYNADVGSLQAGVFTATSRETLYDVYQELKRRGIEIVHEDVLNGNSKSVMIDVSSGKVYQYNELIHMTPFEQLQVQAMATRMSKSLEPTRDTMDQLRKIQQEKSRQEAMQRMREMTKMIWAWIKKYVSDLFGQRNRESLPDGQQGYVPDDPREKKLSAQSTMGTGGYDIDREILPSPIEKAL